MKSDVEIAQAAKMKPIEEIASKIGLVPDDLELYGKYKAKVTLDAWQRVKDRPNGKLILCTAINPTPAGEGKTTTSVGLADALSRRGRKAAAALREPSMGPCFGMKGGAAGGGYAQVVPMEDINLHFTGDFHAITTAHNLLAAIIDNHIQQGNALDLDVRRITWKRVLDLNDRALRHVVIGMGGKAHGVPRETGFDITVASEMMAILCLSRDLMDMKERLGRIVIGYTRSGRAVRADELMATKFALKFADVVVTEAGFGADLGAEKFLDIKCRFAGISPDAVVIVATVRALKMHGGLSKKELEKVDMTALKKGMANLAKHIENVQKFGLPAVVAVNAFPTDTSEELDFVRRECETLGAEVALSEVWAKGGEGGEALAEKVEAALQKKADFRYIYDEKETIPEKIGKIAREIYGAAGVDFTKEAQRELEELEALGFDKMPVCMAKTQYSLSDDAALLGKPEGFRITVRELRLAAGAGFVVALTGSILTMPGLPKHPAAMDMDITEDGRITGLF